jgi:hypothetical protein
MAGDCHTASQLITVDVNTPLKISASSSGGLSGRISPLAPK